MSGYIDCGCRDCFEVAIGEPGDLCLGCRDAGCDGGECQRQDAYGADETYTVMFCWPDSRVETQYDVQGKPSTDKLLRELRQSEASYVVVMTYDGELMYDSRKAQVTS